MSKDLEIGENKHSRHKTYRQVENWMRTSIPKTRKKLKKSDSKKKEDDSHNMSLDKIVTAISCDIYSCFGL